MWGMLLGLGCSGFQDLGCRVETGPSYSIHLATVTILTPFEDLTKARKAPSWV